MLAGIGGWLGYLLLSRLVLLIDRLAFLLGDWLGLLSMTASVLDRAGPPRRRRLGMGQGGRRRTGTRPMAHRGTRGAAHVVGCAELRRQLVEQLEASGDPRLAGPIRRPAERREPDRVPHRAPGWPAGRHRGVARALGRRRPHGPRRPPVGRSPTSSRSTTDDRWPSASPCSRRSRSTRGSLAGSFDDASSPRALEAAGLVAAARPVDGGAVVWAGSARLADQVAALFEPGAVTAVGNARPTPHREDGGGAARAPPAAAPRHGRAGGSGAPLRGHACRAPSRRSPRPAPSASSRSTWAPAARSERWRSRTARSPLGCTRPAAWPASRAWPVRRDASLGRPPTRATRRPWPTCCRRCAPARRRCRRPPEELAATAGGGAHPAGRHVRRRRRSDRSTCSSVPAERSPARRDRPRRLGCCSTACVRSASPSSPSTRPRSSAPLGSLPDDELRRGPRAPRRGRC